MTTSSAAIATREYLAFISYRHADNKQQGRQWATWLHQALETYEVPADLVGKTNSRGEVIPERIYPIFRDEDELPAHADLANSITSALANSRLLVVLCSPNAVASTYVADEIRFFKQLGHSDRIIAAMIDGEPNASWDTAKQASGVPADAECFPLPLQFTVDEQGELTTQRAEPIAADFRVNLDGKTEQGWTNVEALRQHLKTTTKLTEPQIKATVSGYQQQQQLMLLKIIAGILGVPLGELTKRDQAYQLEQQRKKAKRLRQWLSGVAVLALLATGAGIYAWQQRVEAIAQRDRAEVMRNEAQKAQNSAEISSGLALMEKADKAFEMKLNNEGQVYAIHALAKLKNKNLDAISADKMALLVGKQLTQPGIVLQATLQGHLDSITSIAFSPDGNNIASASNDHSIRVWDVPSGKLINTFHGHSSNVHQLIYSSDGKYLVSGSDDPDIRIWDATKGTNTANLTVKGAGILKIILSPNGKKIASVDDDGFLRLWNVSSGESIPLFKGNKYSIKDVYFSPDGKNITSLIGSDFHIWDAETGVLIKNINSYSGNKFVYSPDGLFLASGGDDGLIKIWNMLTGESFSIKSASESDVSVIAYSPNGKIIAYGSNDNKIRLLEVSSGEEVGALTGHESKVSRINFSSDSSMLISTGLDNTVRFWDVSRKELLSIYRAEYDITPTAYAKDGMRFATVGWGNSISILDITKLNTTSKCSIENWINTIAFSPDGKKIATAGEGDDKNIVIRSGKKCQQLATLAGHQNSIMTIAYSPDGKTIASSGRDQQIRLWDSASGKHKSNLRGHIINNQLSADFIAMEEAKAPKYLRISEEEEHEFGVTHLAYSGDGKSVVSSSYDKTIRIWDLATGLTNATLRGHEEVVTSLAYSKDNKILASGSADRTIRFWDLETKKIIYVLEGMASYKYIVYTNDGKNLVSVSDKDEVQIWDVASFELVSTTAGNVFAVSSDSKHISVGERDGTVKIINASTGKITATIKGNGSAISSMAFSPKENLLIYSAKNELKYLELGMATSISDNDWNSLILESEKNNGLWLNGINLLNFNPNLSKLNVLRDSYLKLGDDFTIKGDAISGWKSYRSAKGIIELLVVFEPLSELHWSDLYFLNMKINEFCRKKGSCGKEFDFDKEALRLSDKLLSLNPYNINYLYYSWLSNRGSAKNALRSRNKDLALKYRKRALSISDRLTQARPLDITFFKLKSISHYEVYELFSKSADVTNTEKNYHSALDFAKKIIYSESPNIATEQFLEAHNDFEKLINKLSYKGEELHSSGELSKSIDIYEIVIGLKEKFLSSDSPHDYLWDLSISYDKIGQIYIKQGNNANALKAYQAGLEIAKKLAKLEPNNVKFLRGLSISHSRMAETYQAQNDNSLVLKAYQAGLEVSKKLVGLDTENNDSQALLLWSYHKIAQTYANAGDYKVAAKTLTQGAIDSGIDVDSTVLNDKKIALLKAHGTYLSWSWYSLFTENKREIPSVLTKVINYLPADKDDTVSLHTNLAHAYLLTGDYNAAKSVYEKYKGYKFQDGNTWDKTIIADFEALKKNGVEHESFATIASEIFGVELDAKK